MKKLIEATAAAGKTVLDARGGSEYLAIRFTDDTVLLLSSCCEYGRVAPSVELHKTERSFAGDELLRLGLLDDAEAADMRQRLDAVKAREAEKKSMEERRLYERLRTKLEGQP